MQVHTSLRILVLGNNLNQGVAISELLRHRGWQAKSLVFRTDLNQDSICWWADSVPVATVETWDCRPQQLAFRRDRRKSYGALTRYLAEFDVVLAREDFIGMMNSCSQRTIFWAQGADLQIRPWQAQYDLHSLLSNPLSSNSLALATALPFTYARARQQRRGILSSDAVLMAPYQKSLAEKIGVSLDRIHYVPSLTSNVGFPIGLGGTNLEEFYAITEHIKELAKRASLLLYHPTRIALGDRKTSRFKKNNLTLIEGLASFVSSRRKDVHLILTKKGNTQDISRMQSEIRRYGLEDYVTWVPEIPPWFVKEIMQVENAVIADQFSPDLPSLGDIGRMAVSVGKPLVTSYSGVDDAMFDSSPPNVFSAQSPHDVASVLVRLSNLTLRQFDDLHAETCRWYDRNLSKRVIGDKLDEVLSTII